jgi:hypothetical protein
VTPRDQTSHFELNFYLAKICGAIYKGDPRKVKNRGCSRSSTTLAKPKSDILMTPSWMRKLAGFISL